MVSHLRNSLKKSSPDPGQNALTLENCVSDTEEEATSGTKDAAVRKVGTAGEPMAR